MSQYYFYTNEGRKLLCGLDKPTGGFFFTEFWKDEEIVDDEVKNSLDGLTLTELIKSLKNYGLKIDPANLIVDWDISEDPSPLQYQVNKMFGKDLGMKLERTECDLFTNYK
jgi:hypothetical protein